MKQENKGNYYVITLLNEAATLACTFSKSYIATEEMLKKLYEKLRVERENEVPSQESDLLEEVLKEFLNGNKDVQYMYWPLAEKVEGEYQTLVCTAKNHTFECETGEVCGVESITLRYIYVPDEDCYNCFVLVDEVKNAYLIQNEQKIYVSFETPKNPNIFLCDEQDAKVAKPLLGFWGARIKKEEFDDVKNKFFWRDDLLYAMFEDFGI